MKRPDFCAATLQTHGGWQVRQPEPSTWLWRTPHRRIYLVNATGTHPLGNTEFAQTIWHAASPPQQLASGPTLDREIDRDRAWGRQLTLVALMPLSVEGRVAHGWRQ